MTGSVPNNQPQDYPDVLGMITGGPRFSADVVQCALGVFPDSVAVGQVFEVLMLLQNACDKPIQAVIALQLPRKDSEGSRMSLMVAKDTVSCAMQPGETGLLHVPVIAYPPTRPDEQVPIGARIDCKTPKGCAIMHAPQGGRPATVLSISNFRLNTLRDIQFATAPENGLLVKRFNILAGHIDAPQPDTAARYETLWSVKELPGEQARYAALSEKAARLANTLSRTQVMRPLQQITGRRYAGAGLPLHPAEALYITKALVYVMEDGLESEPGFGLETSRWFRRLTTVIEDQARTGDMDALIDFLYTAIVYDAVCLGLMLVEHSTGDELGTQVEHAAYADEVALALENQRGGDLGHAYLPLILTGVLLNAKIKDPRENLWVSVGRLREAWRGRAAQIGDQFAWLADVLDNLLHEAEQFLIQTRVPRPPSGSAGKGT